MKNTRFFFIPLFILLSHLAFGQSYKTAAGIRLDNGINFTVKQHIANNWTAEGILHTPINSDELGLTILAEKHQKILFRGINLYGGGGRLDILRQNGKFRAEIYLLQQVPEVPA